MWEDDYCQVEVIPKENWDFIKVETDTIEKFAEEHKSGEGFTDIYERKENPVPTEAKKIEVSELETILAKSGLTKVKKFETSEGIVEAENRTRAYKHKNFTLLYDFKANTINNIWILSDFSKQKNDNDLAIKLLNNIDKKYHLILVDWNSSEYIDLAKKEQIKKYLDKFNH